jgi:hypothetical protein
MSIGKWGWGEKKDERNLFQRALTLPSPAELERRAER